MLAILTNFQIHKILLPIYMNPNNEYGLRIVAYLGTIKSQPCYGTLQTIIQSLEEEQSQRVGTFVYSHLQDIMESSRLSLNETYVPVICLFIYYTSMMNILHYIFIYSFIY